MQTAWIQMRRRVKAVFQLITLTDILIFSSTANRHALRALARVGAGAYEYFDAKVKSKWEGKVSYADF